ncbi:hypothetical protein GQ457_11G001980 [Hibiscus cannabinus]
MVEKLGLEGPFGLYWRVSGSALSKVSVRPLRSDSDCMQLVNSLPKKRYIHIYLQKRQNVTEKNNEGDEGDLEGGDDDEVVVEDEVAVENDLEVEDDLEVEEEVAVEEDIGVEEEVAAEEEIGLEDDLEVEEEIGVEDDLEVEEEIGVEDVVVEEEMDVEEEIEVEVEEEVEEEDARENREEFDDSDTEFRADEEEQQENIGIGIRVQRQMDGFGVDGVRVNPEIESDSDKSDELHSDHDSDSDSPRFSEFNNETDMVNPKFVKGLIFSDRNVLKEAIKHYERVNRVQVKLQKNDTKRIQAVCQETCPWKLWAAPMNPKDIIDQTWQIKTLVDSHTCSKGYLLVAVGIDANDGIYPIAYVAMESENYASWHWFLDILKNDLQIGSICFMSDKQKGLVEAIDDIFPNAEVRNCVRHLYNNFKELHKGKALKDVVWKAARATYSREFEAAMDQLKALSVPVYEWIKKINPAQWSKSHFSTRSKCDMLLNNLCESFNKCWATRAGGERYQVQGGLGHQHVVDLVQHTCSCRRWDLSGIPCIHAISAIQETNRKPEDYVNECYHKSTQIAIYSNIISHVKGPEQWAPVTEMDPILPPAIRRPPGRPTKKRRKEADEVNNPKLCKRGQQSNCSKCGMSGHNKRTCRGQIGANQPVKRPTPSSHRPANHHPPSNQQHQPSSTHQQQPSSYQQQPSSTHQQQPSSSQQQPSSSQQQQPQRQKLPPRRQPLAPPTQVNQMPSSQQSNVSNPPNQESQASTRD